MSQDLENGFKVVREVLGQEAEQMMRAHSASNAMGAELADLAVSNVFGRIWSRPGLSLRDRSLVTLGILIALRATDELHSHFPLAIKNGLSREEIAEVIYQASAYAGFPAAHSALMTARELLEA